MVYVWKQVGVIMIPLANWDSSDSLWKSYASRFVLELMKTHTSKAFSLQISNTIFVFHAHKNAFKTVWLLFDFLYGQPCT